MPRVKIPKEVSAYDDHAACINYYKELMKDRKVAANDRFVALIFKNIEKHMGFLNNENSKALFRSLNRD